MASRKIINKYPNYSSVPGPRRNVVIGETGKRLYAADIPYQEHMTKLSQKYLDTLKKIRHSEFKKPYMADDYGEMEYFADVPRIQPPSTPDEGYLPDCEIGTEAAGTIDEWRICSPSDDCAGWVFTCAHKITSFECINCYIKLVQDLPGDRVMVIICSKNDEIAVSYVDSQTGKTKTAVFSRECIGEGANPDCTKCDDCPADTYPPIISYTSQQMQFEGTQNLSVADGGGAPYQWSLLSGGGSLSKFKTSAGEANVYTAPSSNPNCASNPTIEVKDYCGNTATLKLAISCTGACASGLGYRKEYWTHLLACGPGNWAASCMQYTCTNAYVNTVSACPTLTGDLEVARADCVTNEDWECVHDDGKCETAPESPDYETVDKRTEEQKANGCCPVGLLS